MCRRPVASAALLAFARRSAHNTAMTLLPQETIIRKRDGLALTSGEISDFIAGLTDGAVGPAQAAAFAMAVYFRDMSTPERVALTKAMRDSGTVLDWSDLDGPIVDKHSTGGVGDNTSLMLAPILAACGVYVPMIPAAASATPAARSTSSTPSPATAPAPITPCSAGWCARPAAPLSARLPIWRRPTRCSTPSAMSPARSNPSR
jgi:hypothetical protein